MGNWELFHQKINKNKHRFAIPSCSLDMTQVDSGKVIVIVIIKTKVTGR